MAQSLANYSIESDAVVALTFSDGRSVRASVDQLRELLSAEDYHRISAALKLRASYIKKHTPTWAKVVLIGVVILGLGVETTRAAQWYRHIILHSKAVQPPASYQQQPAPVHSSSQASPSAPAPSTPSAPVSAGVFQPETSVPSTTPLESAKSTIKQTVTGVAAPASTIPGIVVPEATQLLTPLVRAIPTLVRSVPSSLSDPIPGL